VKVINTDIHDVKIIEPKVFGDSRGFFLETFQIERYHEQVGISIPFLQDNYSRSYYGVLRGLHLQKNKPQGKLVRVAKGTVFDVVVDVRKDSSSFRKWVGIELSEHNKKQLWVPPGLAHGFVVLTELADFEYKCTDYYCPEDELCLKWDDSDLDIKWPLTNVQLSNKDVHGLSFNEFVKQL
jgi:dTDP-4-dehydrorhamnose 3,5-epimerase